MSAGFRFHPTDEELVARYLPKKSGTKFGANLIPQIDLHAHDPWDLPALANAGEKEWYFFSSRDKKYPARAAPSGYWKAGSNKSIFDPSSGTLIGLKTDFVFYRGQGVKTDWIMQEYSAPHEGPSSYTCSSLNVWVLCRISQSSANQSNDRSNIEIRNTIAFGDAFDTSDTLPCNKHINAQNRTENVLEHKSTYKTKESDEYSSSIFTKRFRII